jgi:hydrogenase/urease accessory protein HupE
MDDLIIYVPFLVIAVFAVCAVWAMRGKDIPNQVIGIAAPLAGAGFLYLFSESLPAVAFGVALLGIGGLAWYRVWRGETGADSAAPPE